MSVMGRIEFGVYYAHERTLYTPKYKDYKQADSMGRVNITIPNGLLKRVEAMAKADYTTRSDIIRQALLFYTRSTAATLSEKEAELLLKGIKSRQLNAYLNKAVE